MYYVLWLGAYIFFPLICIVIITTRLIRPNKNRCDNMFLMLCVFVLGWFVCEFLRMLLLTPAVYNYTIRIGLIFMEFSAITMLLLSILFYRLPYKPPKRLLLLLCIMPFLTIIFSFNPTFWPFVYELDYIPMTTTAFYSSVGAWFWVHTYFCYAIVSLTSGVVLFGHFRTPKFYRFPSTLLAIAILLIPTFHIISFTGHWNFLIPPLALSLGVAVILGHIAFMNSEVNVFVRYARGHIFQHLDECILVLGEDGLVADCNTKAAEWFGGLEIDLLSCKLQDVIDALEMKGAEIKASPESPADIDIIFYEGTFFEVLNLHVHEIIDEKNRKGGSLAIFTDVTKNRDLFKRLEEKAGMDSLTGLANRMAYEGARNRLDMSEHYPLSVVICDADGLKDINDTLGHKYGDSMLQIIAGELEAACPKQGFVARLGGDEFIYLLSQTDTDTALKIIDQVRESLLQRSKGLPYELSVSFGLATKYSEKEDLENVISLADTRMYEDKKESKKP